MSKEGLDGQVAVRNLRAAVDDLIIAAQLANDAGSAPPPAIEAEPRGSADRQAGESGWTPSQVLAHALWWHERYLAVLSAKVDRQPRPRLPGRLGDINLVGVSAYGDRSVEALASALAAAAGALESPISVLCELPPAERSRVRIVTRDASAPIDLDAFVRRVTGHLHGHARELRAKAERSARS